MKKTWKRALAAILALVMVFGTLALASCADDVEPDNPDEKDNPQENPDDKTPDDDPKVEKLPLDYLPTTTYDGAEVHVLEWTANGMTDVGSFWIPWEEIAVDTTNGDVLATAIFDRNGIVEETYDVVITKEYVGVDDATPYTTVIRNNEATGDQAFQMITLRTATIAALCLEGQMTDLNTLSNLHTDMPWWSQDSVKSYTMGDALYFAAPEMLLRDKGATALVCFNQKIVDDMGIEDLFELVEMGEWTMETLVECSQKVAADLDGDDVISSSDDMYGICGSSNVILPFLYAGAGSKFADVNDDGYIDVTIGESANLSVWQNILDKVIYTDFYYENKVDSSLVADGFDPFTGDRSLFSFMCVKDVLDLRNMTSTYGILPIPKYDVYQEDYSSLVFMHYDSVLGIPGSCKNTDMISTVLEHMSYISYYDVYPAFYDTIILGKSARDEQSRKMLELIFKTRVIDPGMFYLEQESWAFMVMRFNNWNSASTVWAMYRDMCDATINEVNQKIEKLQ